MQTFEYEGKEYELKFSGKKIEIIEQVTGKSIMTNMVNNNGLLSLSDLRTYFTNGLKEIDGSYAPASVANKIYDGLQETSSYTEIVTNIVEAVQRDCPFLFRED